MSATAEAVAVKRPRIESVDVLRGVIMIIMALDHVRDFFGTGVNPTNLAVTTVPLFFTRWITHFCAPVFFLLTGTGAYLSLRSKSKRELSRFLFTRGLWLIFLELVPLRIFGFQFNFDYHLTMLFILWGLGWAMIVLSALVYLPASIVTAFGVVMICTHNLFDSVTWSNPLWTILHSPGVVFATPQHAIFTAYPLIPWVGVTAAGYGLGQIYSWPSERRKRFLVLLGIALTLDFFVLRGINLYGDPSRWAVQKSAAFTVLSFLNTTKYPPSLLFLLMTLGPAMLFLWAAGQRHSAIAAARFGLRQSSDVLLRSAHSADSPDCVDRLLRPLRTCVLDVPVSQPSSVPNHSAAGMGLLSAGDLPDLDFGSRDAVSALPLVRRPEAAPQRCLA